MAPRSRRCWRIGCSCAADGRTLSIGAWSAAEPLAERQSIRLHARIELERAPGIIGVTTRMFPYDPVHQTFVNFYEGERVTAQAILDGGRVGFDYYAGTAPGVLAVLTRFVPDGIRHILVGPDHLLFLVGLLLLGGTMRQLLLVVSAFTLAHSLSLSVAALNVFSPSARLVEPAIALAIVYVGADNLMVRGGPDVRGVDCRGVRIHSWLRVRERAERDEPAATGAGLVAVLVQRRRRNRPGDRRARGRDGARHAPIAQ